MRASVAVGTLVVCLLSGTPAGAELLYGILNNQLITFDSATPTTILTTRTIGGLVPNEVVKGIDVRPATGDLYGLAVLGTGTSVRVVVIDPVSGGTKTVGTPFTQFADSFGFDFNPTNDRIRIVTNTGVSGSNALFDLSTGTVTFQTNESGPGFVGAAYSNNVAGAATTTLYTINGNTDSLNIQNPPASGANTLVGPLGIDILQNTGFDISPSGVAYAALTTGGATSLYTINLTTGAATLVGNIGTGATVLTGLAVAIPKSRPIAAGAGPGGGPHVKLIDPFTLTERLSFFSYDPGYTGGVRVAMCDVNGDGAPDIVTGTGPGGAANIRVFDGVSGSPLSGPLGSFFAYDPGFIGGVDVACLDLDGDGKGDVIVGAGLGGGPHVRIFSGATGAEITGFFSFGAGLTSGTFVGAGR